MGKLVGVQYLRAIAALAVLLFHASARFHFDFTGGGAGVDVFFVISGFIMVAITTGDTRPLAFIRERLQRIVPIYWLATSVMVVGAVAGVFPNLALKGWHIAASYLFLPARDPGSGKIWPVLAPGWTLNYEMFFYALFAVMLLLRRSILTVAALSVVLGGLAAANVAIGFASPTLSFYSDPILLEFITGAWIGVAWKGLNRWQRLPAWAFVAVGGLSLTTAVLVVPALSRVVMYGFPAAVLLIGVLALESRGAVRRFRPVELCGDSSYSIYLWHGIAVSVAAMVVARAGLPPLIGVALAFSGGIAGGILSFIILERPVMRWFRRRRVRPATRPTIGSEPVVPTLASR